MENHDEAGSEIHGFVLFEEHAGNNVVNSMKKAVKERAVFKLDPFKPLIDEWLLADKLAPRKQRHTAKRVFKRLKDEVDSVDCSYRLVALYVKQKKRNYG